MKLLTIPTLGLTLLALAGCRATYATDPYGTGYPHSGDLIRGASLDKAILVQHTLYPYHFVIDGAALNDLGERDLHVLAAHFRSNPGSLQVHRGNTASALYEARVNAVMAALVAAGVDGSQVKLTDGLPGGDGLPGEHVVVILKAPSTLGATSGTTTSY